MAQHTIFATVILPTIFSDNMVLQQKTNASIWGKADANKLVTIMSSWNGKKYAVKADPGGNWKIKISTPSYGGPYTISITEENTIELKNVLIGEVWLCSGQSNMEMPLAGWGKINNYQQEIAAANYPNIRLLQAVQATANQPSTVIEFNPKTWEICSPATIANFSSVAYFFAREIYEKTKIPIGLIHSSWGGTIAEAWTSYEALQSLPDFAAAAKAIKNAPDIKTEDYEKELNQWKEDLNKLDRGFQNKEAVWAAPQLNTNDWKTMIVPGTWENQELPGFDGVVWFRKKIKIPDSWHAADLTLNLGTIDDDDICFFNGKQIGSTQGYNVERTYVIPARFIKNNDNYITVRVFDRSGSGGFYSDSTSLYIKNKKDETIALYGNWQYKVAYSLKEAPPGPQNPSSPNRPTVLYNAMISPIINYTIKGAIWYQGEANAERAVQYRHLFPAMIKDWRNKFAIGDFPFYFVQLASFMKRDEQPVSSDWAMLREAQLKTTLLKNTGMAVAIDIGDAVDIHPKNKQEVGKRLALIALNKDYKMNNEYTGPLYKTFKEEGNKMIIYFEHAEGLHTKGNILTGFTIAGDDKQFYRADAVINGNNIIVHSDKVNNPKAVRYGWANNPDANLYNSAGLPASPFRTDDWSK